MLQVFDVSFDSKLLWDAWVERIHSFNVVLVVYGLYLTHLLYSLVEFVTCWCESHICPCAQQFHWLGLILGLMLCILCLLLTLDFIKVCLALFVLIRLGILFPVSASKYTIWRYAEELSQSWGWPISFLTSFITWLFWLLYLHSRSWVRPEKTRELAWSRGLSHLGIHHLTCLYIILNFGWKPEFLTCALRPKCNHISSFWCHIHIWCIVIYEKFVLLILTLCVVCALEKHFNWILESEDWLVKWLDAECLTCFILTQGDPAMNVNWKIFGQEPNHWSIWWHCKCQRPSFVFRLECFTANEFLSCDILFNINLWSNASLLAV